LKILSYIKGDKVIWAIVLLLSLLSILVVYSSIVVLAYRNNAGNTEYYLIKHAITIAFGLLLMYLTHKIKYTYFSKISQIALYIAAPLLLFTLIKGVSAGDASRWLAIPGTKLTFQTSDFAKLALISYVARILSMKQEQIKDFKAAFIPVVIPILIICALILPANFSTAAVLFTTCLVLMFIGRINIKYILSLIGIGIIALVLFVALIFAFPNINNRVSTWKARIENFKSGDSKTNYQVEQAKIAIATGGIAGKGPGNSSQRNFLPQASSDFIYAILIEEYGIVGGIVIVFLYAILFFRGVRIVNQSPTTFGGLLAIGLSFSLVFQAMINMAVAVNLLPVTGQTLPLVSMGGSSIWFTSIAVGIILSVSRGIEDLKENSKNNETGGALEEI